MTLLLVLSDADYLSFVRLLPEVSSLLFNETDRQRRAMLSRRSTKENCNPLPCPFTSPTGRVVPRKCSIMSNSCVDLLPFLKNLRIEPDIAYAYTQKMKENGFDDVPSLELATEEDLALIGIKIGHVRRITRSVSLMKEGQLQIKGLDLSPNSASSSPQQHSEPTLGVNSVQGSAINAIFDNSKTQAAPVTQPVRRLTPEERLEAHRLRKLAESRHKEQEGKWERPQSLDDSRLPIKVRRNDDLVHRLSATATERKVLDNVQKNVLKYKQACSGGYASSFGDNEVKKGMKSHGEVGQKIMERTIRKHEESEKSSSSERNVITSKQKKKKKAKAQKTMSAADKHAALMTRLSLSVKQRRKDANIPAEVKRALLGHQLEKPKWSMADAFAYSADIEFDDELDPLNASVKLHNKDEPNDKGHCVIRCQTCSSTENCEEDVDDPGTFYCQQCWEEFEGSLMTDPHTSQPEKPLANEMIVQHNRRPLDSRSLPQQKRCPRCMKEFSIGHRMCSSSPNIYCQRCENEKSNDLVETSQKSARSSVNGSKGNVLWIVHDNPKLGNKVTNLGKGVKCWVETKDPFKNNCFRVLTGCIEYSGPSSVEAFDEYHHYGRIQGDQCFRVNNLAAFVINYDMVQTRLSKGGTIVEFHLGDDCRVKLSSLKDFFSGCLGSVDVILDPQVSSGNWYPQREANAVGYTKVAPQFRSKGVGYLRLGDDMGKKGLAFLSDDGCRTFFLGPAENSPQPKKGTLNSTRVSLNKSLHARNKEFNGGTNPVLDTVEQYSEEEESDSDESDDEDSDDECSSYNLDEILRILQDQETVMKWSEKAKLVHRAGVLFVKDYYNGGGANANEMLLIVQTFLASKNLNSSIVRNAVILMGRVGECIGKEMFSSASGKTLFLESLKLLKNKQLSGTIKETLAKLHGQCFTLSSMTGTIGQALGVGRSSSAKNTKKILSTKNSSRADSTPNTVEVIEWLNVTIQAERTMVAPFPLLDENSLVTISGFLIGEVAHRDQRCRQNVFEGLANVIAYGIQKLGMKIDAALKLCYTLSQINPKAWKTVIEIMESIVNKGR